LAGINIPPRNVKIKLKLKGLKRYAQTLIVIERYLESLQILENLNLVGFFVPNHALLPLTIANSRREKRKRKYVIIAEESLEEKE